MKRCLIVDDSSVIRKVARHILESMKFEVVEAENGQEALDRCREAPAPDLILLDWHLPVVGALEFLAALRLTPAGRRPFIIYCTTENDPADIARAFQAGADDYFMKPFDRAQLVTKLTEIAVAA
jgi:two-component system chemotaxis response regulator CheY